MDAPEPVPDAGAGPALVDPLPAPVHAVLRRAVLEHAGTERRRRFPTLVHLGTPGGPVALHPVRADEPTDHTLRTDVLAAMLAGQLRRRPAPHPPPLVWLTRVGDLEPQDVDLAWLASARAAYGEAGVPLTFVVVDRHGWRDPRSGLSRRWVRLRPQSQGSQFRDGQSRGS